MGAQEDASVEPLIGSERLGRSALENGLEGGVQSLTGTATVLLDEAVAGPRASLLDAAADSRSWA